MAVVVDRFKDGAGRLSPSAYSASLGSLTIDMDLEAVECCGLEMMVVVSSIIVLRGTFCVAKFEGGDI